MTRQHSPNKLFDSAKLLRRWLTFLRLRVDGETEPSREPVTSASKSVRRGLLFSMVKPEAYLYRGRENLRLIDVLHISRAAMKLPLVQVRVMTFHHLSSVLEMARWWNGYPHRGYQRDL